MLMFKRLGFWTIPEDCEWPENQLAEDFGLKMDYAGYRPTYRKPGWVQNHSELLFDQFAHMGPEDYDADVSLWHRDNRNWNEIVLWSSVASTEILLPDGNVTAGEDGEVIVFNNLTCYHRIPLKARRATDRHFIRVPVVSPDTLLGAP